MSDFTEQFSITSTRRGDCYVVRPDGDLDIATASQLAEALAFAPNVEVDLSQVTFIDSSGLHVLVQARLRIIDAGGKFGVSGANSSILRILEITGLEHLLDMDVDTLTSNGN